MSPVSVVRFEHSDAQTAGTIRPWRLSASRKPTGAMPIIPMACSNRN